MSCKQLLCKPNHTSSGEICKAKRRITREMRMTTWMGLRPLLEKQSCFKCSIVIPSSPLGKAVISDPGSFATHCVTKPLWSSVYLSIKWQGWTKPSPDKFPYLLNRRQWLPFEEPAWRLPSQWAPTCAKLSCQLHPHYQHDWNPTELQIQRWEHTVRQRKTTCKCVTLSCPPGTPGSLPKKSETGRSILKVWTYAAPCAAAAPQVRASHACTSNNPWANPSSEYQNKTGPIPHPWLNG